MSLFPQQNNYTAGSTTPTTGNFNPINMVVSVRGMADTLTNKFILKPANAKGIGGFVFDYEGDTEVEAQSDITDHYSEQNTFFNDHAAQRPQRITLTGYVGEIVLNPNSGVLGALNVLQNKLSTLHAITGKYTPSVVQKIQKLTTSATQVVNKIDTAINRAQNIVGFFTGASSAPTKQEKAYRELYGLWSSNQVFTLSTPFNYFRSVMIERMSFYQDSTTKQWSEIVVTVKEVRFTAQASTGTGLSPQLSAQTQLGRSVQQSQSVVNKGKTQGVSASFNVVKGAFNAKA